MAKLEHLIFPKTHLCPAPHFWILRGHKPLLHPPPPPLLLRPCRGVPQGVVVPKMYNWWLWNFNNRIAYDCSVWLRQWCFVKNVTLLNQRRGQRGVFEHFGIGFRCAFLCLFLTKHLQNSTNQMREELFLLLVSILSKYFYVIMYISFNSII